MTRRLSRNDQNIRLQLKPFRRRFGRDPPPGEPVFFDPPDAPGDVPQATDPAKLRADVLKTMDGAGIAPEIAHAYAKTRSQFVEGFEDRFSAADRAEWNAAIENYRRCES